MTLFSGAARIELALGDALYSQVGPGFPETLSLGERLDRIDLDLDNGHG